MKMTKRTFIVADGENLVLRYQASRKPEDKKTEGTFYIPEILVWHKNITLNLRMEVVRASYYTTHVGDDETLGQTREKIATHRYEFKTNAGEHGDGYLCAHVFKKERNSKKTKSVDINITIDSLRHTYNDSLDALFLLSGDGDYIPLIQEVMRQGKQVFVGAFSNGLNPALKNVPDRFICLDSLLLQK
jgi:uncharacterized LabA/DUF88 family protein